MRGLVDRIAGGLQAKASDGTLDLFREIYGMRPAKSGVDVNWKTALEVTTVLRCAAIIADGNSTVPLKIYRKEGNKRTEATEHPLSELFAVGPNDWQDTLQYRETLSFHLALTWNAFSFKNVIGGRVVELIPFEPGCVTAKRAADYALTYEVTAPNGQRQTFPAASIWHIRGPSWNSWMGMEPIRLAREAIGLALATEESHARLHKNGARPGGIYSVEGSLTDDQHKRLKGWIEQNFQGIENAWNPMILDRAAKWVPVAMSGVDSQHLETRRFQLEEICRAMGVMPIMVGYSDKNTTYASAEQMFLAHAVHTVRPWHRRFEASIRKMLMTPEDIAAGFYPKFLDTELLRGAAKDRADFYSKGLGSGGSYGWLTPNDVRGFEDMDEIAGGDELPRPTNLAPPVLKNGE